MGDPHRTTRPIRLHEALTLPKQKHLLLSGGGWSAITRGRAIVLYRLVGYLDVVYETFIEVPTKGLFGCRARRAEMRL